MCVYTDVVECFLELSAVTVFIHIGFKGSCLMTVLQLVSLTHAAKQLIMNVKTAVHARNMASAASNGAIQY